MKERKTIRVLTTFNRTNYFLHDGRPYGFEYDLLEAYVKRLNKTNPESKVDIHLEWYPVPAGKLIPYLKEGKGDKPAAIDTVEVHYKGTTLDGKEFDSSYKRKQTVKFQIVSQKIMVNVH